MGIGRNPKARPANPFATGRYAGPEYFCDREWELRFLAKAVMDGRDVAVISPRRMGKTWLIERFLGQEEIRGKYLTVYVDAYATSSLAELAARLVRALFEAISKEKDYPWRRFAEALVSLRPKVSFDAETGSLPLSTPSVGVPRPEWTLAGIFDNLRSAPRPAIIAIDEFQAVGGYDGGKVEASLRDLMRRSPETRFIFIGGQSAMKAMFCGVARPFYQSCRILRLPPIPEDKYVEFAMRRFADRGRIGDGDVVRTVYRETHGTTWLAQMTLRELFEQTPVGGRPRVEDIPIAEEDIIGVLENGYRERMAGLSPMQRKLALYLAKRDAVQNLLSAESIVAGGFKTAASIQSACKGLEKAGLADKSDGAYRLCDAFFAKWLRETW